MSSELLLRKDDARSSIETSSRRAANEFQVGQINQYMFVVQLTRDSHANLQFVII